MKILAISIPATTTHVKTLDPTESPTSLSGCIYWQEKLVETKSQQPLWRLVTNYRNANDCHQEKTEEKNSLVAELFEAPAQFGSTWFCSIQVVVHMPSSTNNAGSSIPPRNLSRNIIYHTLKKWWLSVMHKTTKWTLSSSGNTQDWNPPSFGACFYVQPLGFEQVAWESATYQKIQNTSQPIRNGFKAAVLKLHHANKNMHTRICRRVSCQLHWTLREEVTTRGIELFPFFLCFFITNLGITILCRCFVVRHGRNSSSTTMMMPII